MEMIRKIDIDPKRHVVMERATYEVLLKFVKDHHDVCSECEGTGKVYNNADPTSGQWVRCPYYEAIAEAGESQ